MWIRMVLNVKEIYYKKYSWCDSFEPEMMCDGKKVDVNNVKKVMIKYPNGDSNFIDFEPVDRFVSDRDCGFRYTDFIFGFEYKGITLKETARGLITRGCKIFIKM